MGSVTGLVDKATSDLLVGPDWTLNMEICDIVNTDHGQAKDVIKAVKKRISHKNHRVQLLALTLLETLIKNCGEIVHYQVVERNILQEMVRIVRKKMDMHVRDKILVLLDAWQEAFGGPGGKYPQYFWAYDELRRTGVEFPEQVEKTAPIFTPPPTHSKMELSQPGYGMPSHIASRLDEAMASETPQLRLSDMEAARAAMEVLAEMLRAVDPKNKNAVKDEVIVDLVEQCRSTQRRVLQLVNMTSDEELLAQGLVLNDDLQNVLVKHDAIASGSPLPQESVSSSSNVPSASAPYEEDEDEDDFSKLARRPSRIQGTDHTDDATQNSLTGQLALPAPENMSEHCSQSKDQLDLPKPPQPIKTQTATNHEQQLIDLLSDLSPQTPAAPSPVIASNGQPASPSTSQPQTPGNSYASNTFQQQASSNGSMFQQQQYYSNGGMFNTSPFSFQHGYPNPQQYSSYLAPQYQNNPWNQSQLVHNSYIVPWATGYRQMQSPQTQSPNENVVTYGSGHFSSPSAVSPASPTYPPPPWTPSSSESASQAISPQQTAMLYGNSIPVPTSSSQHSPSKQPALQQQRSFGSPSERPAISGEQQRNLVGSMQNMSLRGNIARQASSITNQSSSPKPYMPADRLFGDLIDLRSASTNFKTTRMSQNLSKEGNSNEETT